ERLRQVEARLRQEMLRRSEGGRKSREIEENLRRQPEIDRGRIEAPIKTSKADARFEEGRNVRIAADARVEEERNARSAGEARFEDERNVRIAAEQAKAEAEAKLREMEARTSEAEERLRQAETRLQIEENYKVEINRIRAELEKSVAAMWQAEENHRDEMARI